MTSRWSHGEGFEHRRAFLRRLVARSVVTAVAGSIISRRLPAALAQSRERRVFELTIRHRRLAGGNVVIRVTEGEIVEFKWVSDEAIEIHLHGYDIEVLVRPDSPATMIVEAFASGRFPITRHGPDGGHGDKVLAYLEVYPR